MATKQAATQKDEKLEYTPIPEMNVKKLGADAKDAVRLDKTVYMCRIYGEASQVKSKEARSGDMYSYLIGQFRGINAKGEKFESEKLFLPGGIMEAVESALSIADGKPVQFGYDIFSVVDEKSSVGYRYSAKTLIKSEATDRLTAMSKDLEGIKQPAA